jgi:hypothetical protein
MSFKIVLSGEDFVFHLAPLIVATESPADIFACHGPMCRLVAFKIGLQAEGLSAVLVLALE